MGKKSTPAPPDYEAAAERTAEGNLANLEAQTAANRPNMNTPFGSSEWSQDAGGNWTNDVTLNAASQQALDDQQGITAGRSGIAQGMMGGIGGDYSTPMDWGQFDEYTGNISDGASARENATNAMYRQAESRLDPRFSQRRQEQDAQLRAQGLRPGDEAYDKAIGNLGREETDAYQNAMFQSIREGGAEGQRDQSMDLTAGTFGNQAIDANIGRQMQERGFSLNELNAMLSGQQVNLPGFQQFSQAGRTGGADYTGAANSQYDADMDSYNANQALMNSMMGAGSTAMSFSDIRLKSDIVRIGTVHGRPWYRWAWKWGGRGTGIIAQENLDIAVPHESGFLMVDYGRV